MVTGHRPQKLPLEIHSAIKLALLERVQALSDRHDDLALVTGMALGVDTWFAEIGIKLDIPVIAVIPFTNQAASWHKLNRSHYLDILRDTEEIQCIHEEYKPSAYFDRNRAMVEQSNECIAVWDGSPSGTSHAVNVANSLGVPVDRINPRDFK